MSRPTRKLRRPRPDLSKLQQSWSKVLRSRAVKFEDLHNLCVHQSTSVTYRVRTQSAGSKNESQLTTTPTPHALLRTGAECVLMLEITGRCQGDLETNRTRGRTKQNCVYCWGLSVWEQWCVVHLSIIILAFFSFSFFFFFNSRKRRYVPF